ncbi:MAG TPA: hypothetical protein VKV40_04060 [Ktedonobacteraceae bacterium]|nr:hypothetical protein [Ktedonobacteraceae bacterium]
MFILARPRFLKVGVVSSTEEFEQLYQRAMADMLSDGFACLNYILAVWGEKPKDARLQVERSAWQHETRDGKHGDYLA